MDRFLLQLFSDSASAESGDAEQGEGISAETPNEEADPDKEFEQLISGKFRDSFQKRTQGIIDRRFAKMKGYENTARVCAPLLDRISKDFPDIAPADTERLVNAFLERDKKSADDEKNSRIFKAVEEKLKYSKAQELRDRLLRESEELRETYPSFDLLGEISSSPEFFSLLSSGVSLRRAYECVNLEKIMGSALRYAVSRAGKSTAEAMRSAGRVQENSLADRASSVKRTDVKNLTEKDIMRIISEVGKGAKITF